MRYIKPASLIQGNPQKPNKKPGETIRDYFNRFNAAMIEVKNCDVKTGIEAYKRGLEDSSGLYLELTKYPPENFDEYELEH
ncbi:hypothetical protein OSB04_031480 [Centaurea solstitialis]|uniref:Uncharacterized protein n=1 Tax=Centaurea solstitialis TaxID=347529 RepID=A0AA38VUC8_9ASTR|nr:hypothetical protein OSB04_031480 [Centaurea solstitialis]